MLSSVCTLKYGYDCGTLNSRYCITEHIYVSLYLLYLLYCITYVAHEHILLNMNKSIAFFIIIPTYKGCSNMNASSFITFFTYMLRQNVIPFWKELFVAFKMAPNMNKRSIYFSSYRRLYKGHSCIQKFFSEANCHTRLVHVRI